MPFDFSGLDHAVRNDLVDSLIRDWKRLARPGATWTGAERVAIAASARDGMAARPTQDSPLPDVAIAAARMITAEPAAIRAGQVAVWLEGGISIEQYVELIGVASRIIATDSMLLGLGAEQEPLPEPMPGEPTGEIAENARPRKSWVPMVGGMSIVDALSLVPAEREAMFDYHGPGYMTPTQMGDYTCKRDLDRSQIELIAARTSAVNECFYHAGRRGHQAGPCRAHRAPRPRPLRPRRSELRTDRVAVTTCGGQC